MTTTHGVSGDDLPPRTRAAMAAVGEGRVGDIIALVPELLAEVERLRGAAGDEQSQPEPAPDAAAEQAEYDALRSATDPIAAFNLFVKRNVDPSLHAHFADSDGNEAEFVRRAIRAAIDRAALTALVGGGAGGGAAGAGHASTTGSGWAGGGGGVTVGQPGDFGRRYGGGGGPGGGDYPGLGVRITREMRDDGVLRRRDT